MVKATFGEEVAAMIASTASFTSDPSDLVKLSRASAIPKEPAKP